jgi:hypothetical protein
MTDDELERMRRADPWPVAPDVTGAAARELAEGIMLEPTTSTRRPVRLAALAAAAVAVVAIVVGVAATAGDDDAPERAAPPTDSPTSEPGGFSGLCAERYELGTLTQREYAFDGTVAAVEGDRVTFDVGRWFHGGGGGQVTLEGAATLSGLTSVGDALDLSPGARLLVAGDGGFAWSCGFTQPYDDDVARQWADAFGG